MNRFIRICFILLLGIITSCQMTEPTPIPIMPTHRPVVVQPTGQMPTATPVTLTRLPEPTATPETAVCTLPNPETIPLPDSAHDTIAYISAGEEGDMLNLLASNGRWQSDTSMPGWVFQDSPTPHYLLFPEEPLNLDTPILLEPFTETCQVSLEESRFSGSKPNTCYDFKASPNEHWAAAHTNFNSCGSDLALIDLRGEVPTISKPDFRDPERHSDEDGINYFRFIGEDKLWLAVGHCEGGDIYLFDILSGEVTRLGIAGSERWTSDRTAVAITGSYPFSYGNTTWVFDTTTNTKILPSTDSVEYAYWTPDQTHLLYQTRTDDNHDSDQEWIHLSPRQISIMARETGDTRLLIDDPAYDYYLCDAEKNCGWIGDWIPIRRKPYQPDLEYPGEPSGDLADCAEKGISCPMPLETLALNWQTGEIVDWETAVLPTPTIIPTIPSPLTGPDMDIAPLFTADDNRYSLHTGLDQNSLWCVPQTGEPVPWLKNGINFVYVP